MAHPLRAKAIANARVKNDAVDAKTLDHVLRTAARDPRMADARDAARPAGQLGPAARCQVRPQLTSVVVERAVTPVRSWSR
jgi:hypothetical protein